MCPRLRKGSAENVKVVIKFQRPIMGGNEVLMYNKDRSIRGQLPMDKAWEFLFGDKYKIYCECIYRSSDGFLKIGKEVNADF